MPLNDDLFDTPLLRYLTSEDAGRTWAYTDPYTGRRVTPPQPRQHSLATLRASVASSYDVAFCAALGIRWE